MFATPRLGLAFIYNRFNVMFYNSCGEAAKGAGYRYFCIEFYGECWGYKGFDVTQLHVSAKKCWGKRPNYATCNYVMKNPICVGTEYYGYLYEIDYAGKFHLSFHHIVYPPPTVLFNLRIFAKNLQYCFALITSLL